MALDSKSRALQVSAYQLSQGGRYNSEKADAAESGLSLSWEAESLCLKKTCAEESVVVSLQWQHVTGIWVALRNRSSKGFRLEVTLETSHPACRTDFVKVAAAMNSAGGDFLDFLQAEHAGRLKDGKAPSFALSSWASSLYSSGFSTRGVRIFLGRVSIVFEVLYALCFFAQLEGMLVSKEAKLTQAFSDLWGDLMELQSDLTGNVPGMIADLRVFDMFFAFGCSVPYTVFTSLWRVTRNTSNWLMLLMLLQHLVAVFLMLDAFWRTLKGAIKSAMTFHKAATRVNVAIQKTKEKAKVS